MAMLNNQMVYMNTNQNQFDFLFGLYGLNGL